jgi:restriction system protein
MEDDYSILMSPWHEKEFAAEIDCAPSQEIAVERFTPTSPHSVIAAAHARMMNELGVELLGYIYAQTHQRFESLILDVMLAMGYGGRRRDLAHRVGRSGDGGIDCVIEMDELGLDVIYLQAKRLKPSSRIPVSAVRDFVGGLEARHASKGIFVTTADFTASTLEYVASISKKVVLVNGPQLTKLMIRHNLGILPLETLQFKKIDLGYFSNHHAAMAGARMSSASSHPRR